jgi:hypothetical protein
VVQIRLPFRPKKLRYVLKGRNPKGVWEELGEYDSKVNLTDVLDVIEEYREKGYDYFRLDVYTEDGRYVGREWAKKYPVRRREEDLDSFFEKLAKLGELKEKVMKALGIKEFDPADVIANIIYWEEVKKKLAEIVPKTGELGEIGEIIQLLRALRELGSGLTTVAPATQAPTTASSTPTPPSNLITTPESEVERVAEEIITNVEKRASIPCPREKCVEGESG